MGKLEEMRNRVEAATDGPWKVFYGSEASGVTGPEGSITWDDHNGEVFNSADAVFVAHSRLDMEDMVDTLENLREWAGILSNKSRSMNYTPEARAAYLESSKVILAVIRLGLHDYEGWGE